MLTKLGVNMATEQQQELSAIEKAIAFIKAINTDSNYDYDGAFRHWDDYDVDPLIVELEAIAAKEKTQ